MLLVVLGSGFVLVQRLTQPLEESSGAIVQLDERRPGLNRTVYGLTFESEMGQQMFLRLRNRGRILPYLQEAGTAGEFVLRHRDGEVVSLTDGAEGVTIEEREAPLALYGAALVLALVVLLLTGNALRSGWLLGARSEEVVSEVVADAEVYDEEE
jgi:hypothetical protein